MPVDLPIDVSDAEHQEFIASISRARQQIRDEMDRYEQENAPVDLHAPIQNEYAPDFHGQDEIAPMSFEDWRASAESIVDEEDNRPLTNEELGDLESDVGNLDQNSWDNVLSADREYSTSDVSGQFTLSTASNASSNSFWNRMNVSNPSDGINYDEQRNGDRTQCPKCETKVNHYIVDEFEVITTSHLVGKNSFSYVRACRCENPNCAWEIYYLD